MKERLLSLVLFLSFISLAGAAIQVYDFQVKKIYNPGETLFGSIDISVSEENITSMINSNKGDSISLKDFLDNNFASYDCDPVDCGSDYTVLAPSSQKTVDVREGESSFFGVVLQGSDVEIYGVSFDLSSDFGESEALPLSLDFGEGGYLFKYSEFSSTYTPKNWGCFEEASKEVGPWIQDTSDAYCEVITLGDTAGVEVGALIFGTDDKDLRMDLYDVDGFLVDSCNYDPNSLEGCEIGVDPGNPGDYRVCVGADLATDYRIYKESVGDICGYVLSRGMGSGTEDYGIYAKSTKFASSAKLNSSAIDFEIVENVMDDYLLNYGRDCKENCVVPVEVKGIDQNLVIKDIEILYSVSGSGQREDRVYSLKSLPAKVSYNGTLELDKTGFKVNSKGTYVLSMQGNELLREDLEFFAVPSLIALYPTDIPAGIPVEFRVGVEIEGTNISGKYEWDFGNGDKMNTSTEKVVYTYNETGFYDLKVKADYFQTQSEKVFRIEVISPLEALKETVRAKRSSLDNLKNTIESMPSWYRADVKTLVDLATLEPSLLSLETEVNSTTNATNFENLISRAYSLEIPQDIGVISKQGIELISTRSSINLDPLFDIEGLVIENSLISSYQQEVYDWQRSNIDARISYDEVYLDDFDGSRSPLIRVYTVDVISRSADPGYLVIDSPPGSLSFKESAFAQASGRNSIIEIDPRGRALFEFSILSNPDLTFFASPVLKDLVVGELDACNYNFVCEKDLGEDTKNCRGDCRPVGKLVFYVILAIIFILLIYTWLQIWYGNKYEKFLFEDKKQLYNLLMFISNAKARGKDYSTVEKELKLQGWSGERIRYAIRKSQGLRTGLYEIIPLTKISNYLRDRRARKEMALKSLPVQGQGVGRNINKSNFQRQGNDKNN